MLYIDSRYVNVDSDEMRYTNLLQTLKAIVKHSYTGAIPNDIGFTTGFLGKEYGKILRSLRSDTKYYEDELVDLLLMYQGERTQEEVAYGAEIQPSAYSGYLHHGKQPSEETIILLCLYYQLDYDDAAELIAASGHSIERSSSIPMCTFRALLQLKDAAPDEDKDLFTDIEFFKYACKEIAKDNNVTLKSPIFIDQ